MSRCREAYAHAGLRCPKARRSRRTECVVKNYALSRDQLNSVTFPYELQVAISVPVSAVRLKVEGATDYEEESACRDRK